MEDKIRTAVVNSVKEIIFDILHRYIVIVKNFKKHNNSFVIRITGFGELENKMQNKSLIKLVFVFGYALLIPMCSSPKGPVEGPEDRPYELAPDAVCVNSVPGEWTYLGLKEETVSSIFVHPQNPQVIFAGTGFDFSAQRDGKIFRSINCGETWEKVYEGGHFRGLLLHPNDPYTLFAWHHRPTGALLRSTDGGDTWHKYSDGMHTDGYDLTSVLLINPDNPKIMYVGTSGIWGGAVYKSTNGGRLWEGITMNHWPILASGATSMFMHPDEPNLLLHAAAWNTFISRSEDGGDTWEDVFVAEDLVKNFVLNPENSNQIVAASTQVGLLVSEDLGKNWRLETVTDSLLKMWDVKFVKNKIYVATEAGILKTADFENYTLLNEGTDSLTPRFITSDVEDLNIYAGHWHIDPTVGGGVYVRRLE